MSRPVSLRVPDELHAKVEAIHQRRQAEVPHRPVPVAEVYVDLVALGAAQNCADVQAAIVELQSAPTTKDGSFIAAAVRDRALAALRGEK